MVKLSYWQLNPDSFNALTTFFTFKDGSPNAGLLPAMTLLLNPPSRGRRTRDVSCDFPSGSWVWLSYPQFFSFWRMFEEGFPSLLFSITSGDLVPALPLVKRMPYGLRHHLAAEETMVKINLYKLSLDHEVIFKNVFLCRRLFSYSIIIK